LTPAEIMLDRSAAAAETRSPPPCGEGSGVGVHEHGLGVMVDRSTELTKNPATTLIIRANRSRPIAGDL
jgi:hypothetical protein